MRAEPDDDPSPSSRAPSTSTPDAWTRWLTVANAELAREGVARALRPVQPRRRRIDQSDANDAAATCDARESTLERWRTNDDDLGESCDGAGTSRALRVFSGNDYLGLGEHARTRRAAANAAAAYGCGPRSSALVCGYTDMHRALERELARICETEECVLFPSGFAANATTLPAACGSEDCCIFSDALNHASIVDGCRLARQGGATVRTFAHRDYDELERELKTCSAKRTAVVSDSLFSMDGDYADVERLASLKRKYGFLLILDEAHATLVCGERGGGVAQARGRCADVDVHVGTLSKAVGAHGGFVACSREMKRFLVSRARGHMFSTALPAPVIAAALESLRVFADDPSIRVKLWRNVDRLNAALAKSPTLATMTQPLVSPIGSIVVGAPEAALAASADLLRQGFHVPAIRPPTVPAGTCRLRVALSASHRDEDIDELVGALERAVKPPRSRL